MAEPLVVLLRLPLTARDRQRFGVDVLRQRGHALVIADLSPMLYPGMSVGKSEPVSGIETIANDREFIAFLWRNRGLQFIDLAWLKGADLRRFAIWVWLFGIRFALVQAGLLPPVAPATEAQPTAWESIKLRVMNLLTLRSSVFARLYQPNLVFAGGRAGTEGAARTRVPAHSYDYDLFLNKRAGLTISEALVVFIDQDVPHHFEYDLNGNISQIDADRYYADIRRCLAVAEQALGLPVVIASHPRATYQPNDERFGGRKVVRDQTLELIAQARLVLTHGSTAVNFAVMLRKPMVFITTEQMSRHRDAEYVRRQAAAVGAQLVDASELSIGHMTQALSYDRRAYAEYSDQYIRYPGAPDVPLWQIVSETIGAAGSRRVGGHEPA
jgi:hypothetical protein